MAHLDSLIDRFLEDHRESTGGWALITKEDIDLLHEIVWELVTLKCDADPDGDYPVQVKIVNRRTHEPMHYFALPYREQRNDDREVTHKVPFVELLRILTANLHIAADRLETEVRCEEIRNRA